MKTVALLSGLFAYRFSPSAAEVSVTETFRGDLERTWSLSGPDATRLVSLLKKAGGRWAML